MSGVHDPRWRNALLAGARGLEYMFGAVARVLAGEQPVEASGFSQGHDTEPSESTEPEVSEKRPSEYSIFVADRMRALRAERPEVPSTEHFKHVAQEWKTLKEFKKLHPEDSEDEEAEGLLEGGEEEGEEVTGGVGAVGVQETGDNVAAKEKKEKKKKRKHEGGATAADNAGPSSQKGTEEEGGTAEKRTSKKGKR